MATSVFYEGAAPGGAPGGIPMATSVLHEGAACREVHMANSMAGGVPMATSVFHEGGFVGSPRVLREGSGGVPMATSVFHDGHVPSYLPPSSRRLHSYAPSEVPMASAVFREQGGVPMATAVLRDVGLQSVPMATAVIHDPVPMATAVLREQRPPPPPTPMATVVFKHRVPEPEYPPAPIACSRRREPEPERERVVERPIYIEKIVEKPVYIEREPERPAMPDPYVYGPPTVHEARRVEARPVHERADNDFPYHDPDPERGAHFVGHVLEGREFLSDYWGDMVGMFTFTGDRGPRR